MIKKLPSYSAAQNWLQKCFNPTTLVPKRLRGTLMGVIITITLAEVCLYKMVSQDIKAGEMPSHLADTLIIGYGVIEMALAPLVSWCGYRRRRRMLIIYVGLVAACLASWFLLPSSNYRLETELCNDENRLNDLTFTGVTWISAVRLSIFLINGLLFEVARIGVWSHGLAYLEEYAPERTPVHYSIFVVARVILLIIGNNFIHTIERNISIQATIFLVGMLINVLQLHLLIPKDAPEVKGVLKTPPPMNDRSFSESIGRVMSNPLIICQLLAMALLAASLWGYAFFRSDIVKVKFNIKEKSTTYDIFSELIQYILLILVTAFASLHLSHPLLLKFCKVTAVKQAMTMSVLALTLYVLLVTMPSCDKGVVAGMKNTYYEAPACSSHCMCKPRWEEFTPVCMLDDMTTYLSPCQAGCTDRETVNGFTMYVNCTCGGRATAGACSADRCRSAYDMHQTLFMLLVVVVVVALSAQGVVLLKGVDARDRSVGLGVGCATTALMVNICMHTYFSFIKAGSCGWEQSGRCHVASSLAPTLVGGSSAVLAAISFVISLVTRIQLRRKDKERATTL